MTYRHLLPSLLMVACLPALAACTEEEKAPPVPIRPVLSVVVEKRTATSDGFAGSIEPRFTTDLAFRVLGRLVARDVDVGDSVRAGERVAAIDPLTQELSVRAAQSDLSKAQAQLENATASEMRKRELLARNVGTQSDVDQAEQAQQAADAAVVQARSAMAKAREKLDYTQIVSDMDGVVTSVSAEVGQQIPSGQTVMTVARVDVREAVVDVPENEARMLSAGAPFTVALQIDPEVTARGRVREIAPEADTTTGTRRVKITLVDPPVAFRVGTTITATPVEEGTGALRLPRTAILEKDGKSFVWLVAPKASAAVGKNGHEAAAAGARGESTVSLRAVTIADSGDSPVRITDGLEAGDRVVTAGAHSLAEGQTVKLGEGLSL